MGAPLEAWGCGVEMGRVRSNAVPGGRDEKEVPSIAAKTTTYYP